MSHPPPPPPASHTTIASIFSFFIRTKERKPYNYSSPAPPAFDISHGFSPAARFFFFFIWKGKLSRAHSPPRPPPLPFQFPFYCYISFRPMDFIKRRDDARKNEAEKPSILWLDFFVTNIKILRLFFSRERNKRREKERESVALFAFFPKKTAAPVPSSLSPAPSQQTECNFAKQSKRNALSKIRRKKRGSSFLSSFSSRRETRQAARTRSCAPLQDRKSFRLLSFGHALCSLQEGPEPAKHAARRPRSSVRAPARGSAGPIIVRDGSSSSATPPWLVSPPPPPRCSCFCSSRF